MKNLKHIACGAVLMSFGFSGFADTTLFDNTGVANGYGFTVANGQPIGNQVSFGSGETMTSFGFEYYSADDLSANTSLGVEVNFYLNNGPLTGGTGGYPTPGTLAFSSGWYYNTAGDIGSGYNFINYSSTDLASMDTGLPGNELPSDLTFTITFTNLGSDTILLPLANSVASPLATDYGTYWMYNSGTSQWQLMTNTVAANIVSTIDGTVTVPEPSAVPFVAVGGVLFAGMSVIRRKRSVGI